jgi:multimeric flavodoxin WrbA
MNATILDGTGGDSPSVAALAQSRHALASRGYEVEVLALRGMKLGYCLGCFECWTKTPGICRIEDDGRFVARAIIGSDLVLYLTPVTFGGYSSTLKMAVDRSICLISPFFTHIDGEVHHRARYSRYPSLAALGLMREPDPEQEALFEQILARNAVNMHAPGHAAAVAFPGDDVTVLVGGLADRAAPAGARGFPAKPDTVRPAPAGRAA